MALQIYIDGTLADFTEVETLPFSLSNITDVFLEVVGTRGITIDNSASNLMLPASKKNLDIFGQPHVPGSNYDKAPKIIVAYFDNSIVFSGKCIYRGCEFILGQPDGIKLELYGGNTEFFGLVEDKNLDDLPLGVVDYDVAEITASWASSYPTRNHLYAPVVYKNKDTVNPTFVYEWDHFRPHIYFAAIIEALEDLTQYTISSQFFQTDFFRKHVYLFGVGDQWEKGGNSFVYEQTRSSNWNAATQNQWEGIFSIITIASEDFYSFDLQAFTADLFTQVRVRDVNTQAILGQGIPGAFVVPSQVLTAGQQIVLEGFDDSQRNPLNDAIVGPIVFTVRAASKPTIGTTVDLGTCLHQRPITEFLRGISHMFNLAWAVNTKTRTLTVEPRFPYTIDGADYPGFYFSTWDSSTGEPQEYTSRFFANDFGVDALDIFGNHVAFRQKIEDSELGEKAKLAGQSVQNTGFLKAEIPLGEYEEKGETVENPYFENLLLINDVSEENHLMPIVIPEYSLEDGFPDNPTFISEPKYAVFDGNRQFGHTWEPPTGQTGVRPILYQRPPTGKTVNFFPSINGSYADYLYQNSVGNTQVVPGYVSIFYTHWAACIQKGFQLTGRVKMSGDDFYNQDFRKLKRLNYGTGEALYILIELNNYQPLAAQEAEVVLLLYQSAKKTLVESIIHNSQAVEVSL